MGTIDNLNFKVIIDDKDFNKTIKQDLETARKFNVELSKLLTAQKKYNELTLQSLQYSQKSRKEKVEEAKAYFKVAQEAEKARRERERANAAEAKTAQEYEKTRKALVDTIIAEEKLYDISEKRKNKENETNSALERQKSLLKQLVTLSGGYLSARGLFNFAKQIATVTGEFEMQREALRNIVQDVNAADAIFKKLQGLAVQSPFTFQELTSYAKQLSAFSIPINELYDTTKMLADVSAGLGVDMSRLILAYGQVKAATVLRGQEVRQFTEAGIPLLQKLAEQFSVLEGRVVSTGEVFEKVSKRLVPFEMVKKVLVDLTSEGGQFFDMQSVLADTLGGKIRKLKDAYQQMLFQIGESNSGMFHGALDTVIDLVKNYEQLEAIIKTVIISYGAYQVAAITVAVATKGISSAIAVTDAAFVKLGKTLMKNPYAIALAGVVALGSYLYTLNKRLSDTQKIHNALKETSEEYQKTIAEEEGKLGYLFRTLEKLEAGSKNYNAVKAQLIKGYGTYLSDLDKEKLAVGDLTGLYEKLTAAVKLSSKERLLSDGLDSIQKAINAGKDRIGEQLDKLFDGVHIDDEAIRMEIKNYVSGVTTELSDSAEQALKKINNQTNLNTLLRRNMVGQWFTSMGDAAKIGTANIDDFKESLARLINEGDKATKALMEQFENGTGMFASVGEETKEELEDWQKAVNQVLIETYGDSAEEMTRYIKTKQTNYTQYVDGLRSDLSKIQDSIADVGTFESKEKLEEEAKVLTTILDTLGKKYKELKAEEDDGSNKEDPVAKAWRLRREELQKSLDAAQAIKRVYDELSKSIPESLVPTLMKEIFKGSDNPLLESLDFKGVFSVLADELDKTDKKGAELAESIRNGLNDDKAKQIIDDYVNAFKAGEKFYDSMRKWLSKDFNLEGTGAVFDISKIISDLNTANAKVDSEGKALKDQFESAKGNELAIKALREKYGEEVWNNYLSKGETIIDELMKKEREYNVKVAQEKINALAEKYADENLNIDLSGFSKMSLSTLKQMKQKILDAQEEVHKNGIKLSDEQKKALSENGLTTEQMINGVIELLKKGLQNLSDAEIKRVGKAAQEAGKWIGLMGDGINQLGNASSNSDLARTGEALKSIGSAVSSIGQGFSTMGVWGAISAGVVAVFNEITSAVADSIQQLREARLAAIEYANAISLLELEMSKTSSNIWGDSLVSNISEAFSKSQLALDKYIDALDEINGLWDAAIASDDNPFKKATDGAASLEEKLVGIELMMVRTKKANWLSSILGEGDHYEALADLAPEIFEGGDINLDALESFLQTYGDKLSDVQKEQLNYIKKLKEEYESLQEEIEESVSSLVNSLASDLTSQLIENFKTAGNAVDDLKSSFESLGETILNSLLNSFIIDDILEEYTPLIKDLINNYAQEKMTVEDVALGLSEITDGIQNKLESSSDIINQMIAAFQDKGLLKNDSSESSSSTLSEGIKSITEDTASLLASYVNAIRADVSYGKVQRESIANDVKAILGLLPASPSLTEYLTQIQANTYNISVSTQNILTELQSVIAPYDGGGYAINVNN